MESASENIALNKSLQFTVINNQSVAKTPYVIISWNINGYRDDIHQWLSSLILNSRPDVIFLSETKKPFNFLVEKFSQFTDYNYIINTHDPAKWHGVAMLIRKDHSYKQYPVNMNITVRKDSNQPEAATGRIILIQFNQTMYIIGTYTPNSGKSDPVKFDYRTKMWDPTFNLVLEILQKAGPTIWIGDINVALDNIDVSNVKTMSKYAGFTPQERNNLKLILQSGDWIDIWRYQHPNDRVYTWCGSPHKENYGMRLDNIIISKTLLSNALDSFVIHNSPICADHKPIGIYLNPLDKL